MLGGSSTSYTKAAGSNEVIEFLDQLNHSRARLNDQKSDYSRDVESLRLTTGSIERAGAIKDAQIDHRGNHSLPPYGRGNESCSPYRQQNEQDGYTYGVGNEASSMVLTGNQEA